MENTLLNVPATRTPGPGRPTVPPWLGAPDCVAGAGRGAHVWPLRAEWHRIVQAACALGPACARAGDGSCRMAVQVVPLGGTATLAVDTADWACGMATLGRQDDGRPSHGLVFYDGVGRTVLRLDLDEGLPPGAFLDFVERFAVSPPRHRCGGPAGGVAPAVPRLPGAMDGSSRGRHLALRLARDALLEVLHQARRDGVELTVCGHGRGVQLQWQGRLHELAEHGSVAAVAGPGLALQWHQDLLQATLLREPTPFGLAQRLAVQTPDGGTGLVIRARAPAHAAAPVEPCAWRNAIEVARGGRSGSAC